MTGRDAYQDYRAAVEHGQAVAARSEHEHNWIVLVAEHGPDAPYGCQQCPAQATGREIAGSEAR